MSEKNKKIELLEEKKSIFKQLFDADWKLQSIQLKLDLLELDLEITSYEDSKDAEDRMEKLGETVNALERLKKGL